MNNNVTELPGLLKRAIDIIAEIDAEESELKRKYNKLIEHLRWVSTAYDCDETYILLQEIGEA